MVTTFDQKLADYLNSWTVDGWPVGNLVLVAIAIFLAIVLCGVVGLEREWRGRSAGLRTHLLVGLGSCIIMIISIYGFPANSGARDVARLAAQIITGVGFLGAGAIIHRSSGTRGLTTAATIWIVMAIGLACGSFNFILAIGGTFLIIIVLTVFRKFENIINKKAPLITLRAKENTPITAHIMEVSQNFDCYIDDFQVELLENQEVEVTFLAVSKSNEFDTTGFIAKLETLDGVIQVGVMNNHKR